MNRTRTSWTIFSAAVLVVLGVMVYFTVRMLSFEETMAHAQANAALEENVRLSLWRMDSTAALIAAAQDKSGGPGRADSTDSTPLSQSQFQSQTAFDRLAANSQTSISVQEYGQRQLLTPKPVQNWQAIEPLLLERIRDILPGARLEPVMPGLNSAGDVRRLASIPARLVVPADDLPSAAVPWNTPLRISLMIAWGCAILATTAVARLLGATLSLSERRGAFAAAVTHELRTPVTTCRMYSEMLATGVITTADDRQHYLETLAAESDRLGHLIENVLTYSRLERRLPLNRQASITVSELLERTLPSLRRRAEQAKLPLNVDFPSWAAQIRCRTDIIAVQQILLNLVDNACKFGKSEINLSTGTAPALLHIRVSDKGPGVDPKQLSRLFVAFGKSKTDAVPGIGLGLYLSRRLARELGGDLEHVISTTGAAFTLTLPHYESMD